jgi:hypothetical protein
MHSMIIAVLIATTVFGMVRDAKGGETNVVFRKTLSDGRTIEMKEMRIFHKVDVITNKAAGSIITRGFHKDELITNEVANLVMMSGPAGTLEYEMLVGGSGAKIEKVWEMDSEFISDGMERLSRCSFLDVASKGNKIAILYTRNVGLFLDVVGSNAKSESRSHHLMNSMSPTAVLGGQLAWVDDDMYVLIRAGNSRRVMFLVGADGKCTRMKIEPDTESRGTIAIE